MPKLHSLSNMLQTASDLLPDALRFDIGPIRKQFSNPLFLGHVEKAAERFESWSESRILGHIAAMRQMMKQMQSQLTATAKA